MDSTPIQLDFSKVDLNSNALWEKLYHTLRPFIRKFVFRHKFSLRKGQENDVAEDLLQEAVMHVFKYLKRVAEGLVAPIDSIEKFSYTTAMNVCRDWWRKERNMQWQSLDDGIPEHVLSREQVLDPAEVALSAVYQEWVFLKVAPKVVGLPHKTRRALLVSLADLMAFGGEPTPLQRVFLQHGIEMADYRGGKPTDAKLRSRHASLLSQAYKKLASSSYC